MKKQALQFFMLFTICIGTLSISAQKKQDISSKEFRAKDATSTQDKPKTKSIKTNTEVLPSKSVNTQRSDQSLSKWKDDDRAIRNLRTPKQIDRNSSEAVSSASEKTPQLAPTTDNSNALAVRKTELYNNFWTNYNVHSGRKAARQLRPCGCRGDITFVNETSDTLDFYFSYLSPEEVPSLDDAVLQSVKQKILFPSFYVIPGDSATIRGHCKGGLQYEVISRNNIHVKENYLTPRFEKNSFIRMSCMSRTILIK